jgi:alkylhydroperoxidase family enzyme
VLRVQSKGENALVAHVKHDWRIAPLSDGDAAMLAYAEKLTLNPSAMTLDDLNELRAHFSEEQALDIVVIASLFNFMDRIADGLGVELDAMLKQMTAMSPEGEALTEVAAPMRTHRKANQ